MNTIKCIVPRRGDDRQQDLHPKPGPGAARIGGGEGPISILTRFPAAT